ncbi:MAG: Nif3-like dinuclear metal center hexameric protein [Bacteroidetes bacterium]|nr:Nif3-like dinuclear metal center hexameric protein [Bacteroidota bacterium]MBM3425029.1 Nif3-like dinuclear metal center hexameric protein [Bacteroidota bacterium]
MKSKQLIDYLEGRFPLYLQESYDNSGLQIGDLEQEVKGVLIALDCTEEVVREALKTGCNTLVTHHPLLFKGIKRIGNQNAVERIITTCIKNDLLVYAIHTNLDNHGEGVNKKISDRLGLINIRALVPVKGSLYKLTVFTPLDDVEKVHKNLCTAGAGAIGNYYGCSFQSRGTGTFTPNNKANPTLGKANIPQRVEEVKMEYLVPKHLIGAALNAMHQSHPYEEVAHDLVLLENTDRNLGSGMIGELPEAMSEPNFLNLLKIAFRTGVIRSTAPLGKPVKRVAVCGGSGSFLLKEAIQQGADVFVSSDFKYHDFFEAEGKTMVADIGHYESEQYTQELLLEIIKEKFPNFAVRITEHNTNPINFL